jgi:hypothetical protein
MHFFERPLGSVRLMAGRAAGVFFFAILKSNLDPLGLGFNVWISLFQHFRWMSIANLPPNFCYECANPFPGCVCGHRHRIRMLTAGRIFPGEIISHKWQKITFQEFRSNKLMMSKRVAVFSPHAIASCCTESCASYKEPLKYTCPQESQKNRHSMDLNMNNGRYKKKNPPSIQRTSRSLKN